MEALLRGETIKMPTYNFVTGKREFRGETISMGEGDVLIIEGIHCLNDELTYSLPVESKYKIYISALSQLNVDEHNRVASRDGRLVRRIIRDHKTRGYSASQTIMMWDMVQNGEERFIFPFQETADVFFNSALPYELAVMKSYVQPLLFSVGNEDPARHEARRLLKFLDYFLPLPAEDVPTNSILREFIGGGCFRL
jgi:uridine kinase